MEQTITGIFKKEIFRNEENGYMVGKVRVPHTSSTLKKFKDLEDDDNEIVITGYFPQLLIGERYHFTGDFVENNYGTQFSVVSYEMESKDDEESLIAFLSGDLFKGIGKVLAKRIVTNLGTDAIEKISKDKACLFDIPGVTKNKAEQIYEGVLMNYESQKIIRFLMNHGFGGRLANKIFSLYRERTIQALEENPYRLIEDVDRIGFVRADQFAEAIGFDLTSPYRIAASIKYVFRDLCYSEGYTYINESQLKRGCLKFLNNQGLTLEESIIDENLDALIRKNEVVKEGDRLYLRSLYEAERSIADRLYQLSDKRTEEAKIDVIHSLIQSIEKDNQITYTDKQKEAIIGAITHPVLVLTGGPGTGKTTVVNGIIKVYEKLYEIEEDERSEMIALVAPTGRAAKRMHETTGCHAMTIHRLLGYDQSGNFKHDKDEPIGQQFLICDESSMLDVTLAKNFLDAIPNDSQLVFVGDINQLPSVGPGQVLKDLIDSKCIPCVRLDKIQRQKGHSTIIELAHDINEGVVSKTLLEKQPDRNFIPATNDQILERLSFIIQNALQKKFTIDQIQVLAPMYKGEVGIDAINTHIQASINPKTDDKKEVNYYQKIFRQGDKVIQLVNRPTDFVMNGDIGYIEYIFEEVGEDQVKMIVKFDEVEVKYQESELDQLTLAYCISIHKAQGSEFEIVILVLSKSYTIMLKKKLVYTAVTRAKKSLILLGDPKAYQLSLKNDRETIRQTTLKQKLEKMFKTNSIEIDGFEFERQEYPNLTPYDFLSLNT